MQQLVADEGSGTGSACCLVMQASAALRRWNYCSKCLLLDGADDCCLVMQELVLLVCCKRDRLVRGSLVVSAKGFSKETRGEP